MKAIFLGRTEIKKEINEFLHEIDEIGNSMLSQQIAYFHLNK